MRYILLFFSFLHSALGISVDWDIQPRVIQLGEAATCTITIQGSMNVPQPRLPEMKEFAITSSGTQRSMSFGSGGQGATISFTYTLVPQTTGKFTIGPFQYAFDNETATLPAIEVEVVAGAASQNQNGSSTDMSQLLFAKISSDRANVYNQETFDITLAIYSAPNLNLDRNVSLVNMPTTGLRLQQFQELGLSRETINNQLYDVRRFRCKATALTAGQFTLEPTLRVAVLVKREQRHRRDPFFDPFSDMFFGGVEAQPVDVTAEPLDVTVLPLPEEGKPDNFSGAVGHFSLNVQVKPTEIEAGNPITVTTEISGDGNLDVVSAPQISASALFKVYEPKLTQKQLDEGQTHGQKIFEQVVIPKNQEATNLPAIAFSYFNPTSARYETISRGPFPLTVHRSSSPESRIVQAGEQQQPTAQVLGVDIIYLKPLPKRWHALNEKPWYVNPLFLSAQLIPPLFLGWIIFFTRRRDELARDVSKARRHLAPKVARKDMLRAEEALKQKNRQAYFESIWAALTTYFGHRLNLAPGEVSKETVAQRIKKSGLDPSYIERVNRIFDICERERYGLNAGVTSTISEEETKIVETIWRDLNDLLRECEKVKL